MFGKMKNRCPRSLIQKSLNYSLVNISQLLTSLMTFLNITFLRLNYKQKKQVKFIYIGIVRKNKYTNFEIEIKPWDETITNETQCLGLLNINHLTDRVEMRISTNTIFYFTDIYIQVNVS